ncbi:uncharacterized protein IUM83_16058 [Phytophthora cinnamomi]|uniref:uncharacterized protein n=1 Tax=Phytophthora cinnamomi TaxID=4785 RepID=UPI0035598083|nr:hypothetical protein IUM83_16058 [Phytophthora cinnamomi]
MCVNDDRIMVVAVERQALSPTTQAGMPQSTASIAKEAVVETREAVAIMVADAATTIITVTMVMKLGGGVRLEVVRGLATTRSNPLTVGGEVTHEAETVVVVLSSNKQDEAVVRTGEAVRAMAVTRAITMVTMIMVLEDGVRLAVGRGLAITPSDFLSVSVGGLL